MKRFGKIDIDLAANKQNALAKKFYSAKDDAFTKRWHGHGTAWLNPPFSFMRPWAEKCEKSMRKMGVDDQILLLTPAAVETKWFRHFIFERARVLLLNPRLTFVGQEHPYPKGLMLSVFEKDIKPGIEFWDWKEEL